MDFQIDICEDKRTPEQNAHVEKCRQAVKLLKTAGFNASLTLLVVSKPTNIPACIEIEF